MIDPSKELSQGEKERHKFFLCPKEVKTKSPVFFFPLAEMGFFCAPLSSFFSLVF